MKNDRRQFIRDVSLTATALSITSQIGAAKTKTDRKVISCGPEKLYELTGSVGSIKSGNWSDPATWSGGKVPGAADTPLISSGHTVVFDLASTSVAGASVAAGGTLAFDTGKSTLLQTTKNVVILGKLQMRPASAAVIQTLRFINVNENSFVGGGMDVLDSDVGLWVMGAGALDLLGTTKKSWTSAAGAITSGSSSISVADATGWKVGDVISIAPTEAPTSSAFATGFDEANITSVSGNTIGLSKATTRSHPVVNGSWKAEVMNLSRNVCIEGTAAGKAHLFIRSTSKQNIRFAAIRYFGSRKDRTGDSAKELIAGRYGIHFHHCMESSRGSIVEGTVVRDNYNHSFVPHVSHGIQFKDNIAYNVLETAFWYDPGDDTHDVVYDHNIVALGNFVNRAADMNAEDAPTFSSSGFSLNTGDGNTCKNNVVVGAGMGDPADGGAFNWEAVENEGVWIFFGNTAHNNDCGLRVWQNSTRNHVVEDFTSYHNKLGMFHGAYANSYTYNGGIFYGNGIQLKAASVNSNRVRIENMTIDGAGIVDYGIELLESPLPGEVPIMIRNVTFRNCKVAAVHDNVDAEIHSVDLVQCNITGAVQLSSAAVAGETIRVQPASGTPYKVIKSGKSNITAFVASVWGVGKGLKGEYFTSANLTNPAFTRIDSNISFSEWTSGGIHHLLGKTHSIRWTGKVMAQYSEAYTFSFSSGGGHRVWINGNSMLDSWSDKYPDVYKTAPVTLEAGKLYDIKIEYFSTDDKTGAGLLWSSKSQLLEYVPQSQLYAEAITEQPTANKPPVANAGADITVILPASNAALNGTASSDPEGAAIKYAWSQVSGATVTIATATSANASVSGLKEGTYVFRVKVTDDKGATAQDDVSVIVKPAGAENKNPVASAGTDITITLPTNKTTLTGAASRDEDGTISTYNWSKVSGPTQYTMSGASSSSASLTGLVEGVYVFRLKVTDNKGGSAQDEVTVTVRAAGNGTPVANAGNDILITAPSSSVSLDGSKSTDPDGTITAYQWAKLSGPNTYSIQKPTSSTTAVSGLVPGVYVFRLTVTDNKQTKDTDDVTVTVKESANPGNSTLTVTATPNPFTSFFTARISASNNTDPINVAVYDSKGARVELMNSVKGSSSIIMGSSWIKGTYYLVVWQGSVKKVLTIMKG